MDNLSVSVLKERALIDLGYRIEENITSFKFMLVSGVQPSAYEKVLTMFIALHECREKIKEIEI